MTTRIWKVTVGRFGKAWDSYRVAAPTIERAIALARARARRDGVAKKDERAIYAELVAETDE